MAPTKQTSKKSFQSTTADPPRRSTRTPASGISQPKQRVPIQCTSTNCTARVVHFHPLSKDPQQHFLPRPEHATESVGFANPEPGSLSQQFASAQISVTQTMSQSTIQRGPKITKNTQTKSTGAQKKVTKAKRAKARTIGEKTRARDRADAREQRARQQVQKLIEDAETAARLHDTDRVTAIDEGTAVELLPCNDGGLDVIKQHEFISGATSMDDPQTPIHQTSEKQLTSPPAVSRSPQFKHHGYMEFQGSPLGRRWSRRGREPECKQLGDDIVLPPGIIRESPAEYNARMDGLSTQPRTLGLDWNIRTI